MNNCERKIVPGQIYKHFKGKMYQIVTVAIHSENGEKLVIYQKLYDDFKVHARPYDMFLSEVDHNKYPNVTQKYRFELVTGAEVSSDTKQEEQKKEFNTYSQLVKAAASTEINPIVEKAEESRYEEGRIDPRLVGFLDAETFDEKRRYLIELKDEITDRLIDDMAMSMDVTIEDGDIDKRFSNLLYCISTRAKYEVNRK